MTVTAEIFAANGIDATGEKSAQSSAAAVLHRESIKNKTLNSCP